MGRNTQGNRNGGRGGGKGAKKSQKTKKSTSKSPTNKKYLFTTLESTADVSVSTYETTLKKVYVYLMQNTKEYPADLVDSLKAGSNVTIDAPELRISEIDEDVLDRQAENEAFKMEYTQLGVEFRKRSMALTMNLRVAYTVIFDKFCDTAIKHRIECKENLQEEIEGDPYKLLTAIKEIMHSTSSQRLVSPYDALWATMAQLFKLKQEKDESLADYYNKMKAFSEQTKKYFATDLLDKFVRGTNEWDLAVLDVDKRNDLEKGAWNRLVAMGFWSIRTKRNMVVCSRISGRILQMNTTIIRGL